ncbi:MAG TPA: hypothetical protein VNU26_16140 [Mycobacteriales bacterium]|nr:hypothetical protein [Mycobacteriales bacterium]
MPAVLRAAPWGAVLGGTTAGALLLLVAAGAPRAGAAFVPLALALLAGAAAFVLDEPAAAAVDAAPRSLRSRTAVRAVVALVPFAVGSFGLLVAGQHAAHVWLPGTVALLAGCVLVAVAVSTALRRRLPAPGESAAAAVGLSIVALATFEPLSRWVSVMPTSSDAAWGRTAAVWSVVAVVCGGVAAAATRDPLAARWSGRPRRRRRRRRRH